MFSLLRGRITASAIVFLIVALIRGGGVWLRQHSAQMPSGIDAQPTFIAPVAAMQRAQASSVPSTPIPAMPAEVYVKDMTSLLEQANTRLYAVLDLYDDLSKRGAVAARLYNQGVAKIVAEAGGLHRVANEIRAMHPPQIFESYHDETLQALAAAEGALVTLMRMADGGPGLTQAEQDAMTQTFNEAAASLNTYPRLESHTSSGQALATLRASIINSRSDASQRPRPSTPQPHNAP